MTSLPSAVLARQLEHVRAHHQVRVPVAARVRAVRADAADLGGEVEDELGPRVLEQPLGVVPAASGRSRRRRATKTSWPSASRRSTRCEPRKPPPPVTRIFMRERASAIEPVDAADPARRGSRRTSDRPRDAFLPGDLRLPAGLAVQLLVADAQRHHLARARAGTRSASVTISRAGPVALLPPDAEDQLGPVAHRDVLALPVDVDVAGDRRARRRSGGRGRRRCRSRSRAAARAGRARPLAGRAPA